MILNIEVHRQNLLQTCDPKYKFIGKTGPDESTLQALSGEQSQNRQNSTDLHGKKMLPGTSTEVFSILLPRIVEQPLSGI